jgi:predicted AlkP superfamily pyrophosphatase or phosphodiesterase
MYKNVKVNHSITPARATQPKLRSFLRSLGRPILQCAFVVALLAGCSPADTARSPRKAVFIILDGIPADVIETIETPVLDEIASKGGYSRSFVGGRKDDYSQSPTISAVGYNHVLTGVWTNKHNVWDNDIEAPNYNYWNIFRIAESANPDIKTAIFSSWTDNRTKLVGEGLPEAGGIKLDYSFDGLEHDTVRFPHTADRTFMHAIDEAVATETGRYLREQAPDLSWVYLEFTDDMGHMYGDSEQFYDAIRKADAQVGRIWEAIRYREENHNEKWMIVITTDHGRDAETGRNHGGQSERERTTWIFTNLADLNDHFRHTPAVTDIMPSIVRFMEIPIPPDVAAEVDGIPFTGDVSICNLRASRSGDDVELTWDVHDPSGQLEVFISTTNHFKEGQPDTYRSVGKVDVSAKRFAFAESPEGFLKIRVEAPYNGANVWIE